MSEGRKFTKTDSNLSPEDRLAVVERNYAVILERIQSYDKILEEFALIKIDLKNHGQLLDKQADSLEKLDFYTQQKIGAANSKLMALGNGHDALKSNDQKQSELIQDMREDLHSGIANFYKQVGLLEKHLHDVEADHNTTRISASNSEKDVSEIKKSLSAAHEKIVNNTAGNLGLENKLKELQQNLKSQIDTLMTSFQNMPEFNEWATKIYIRVCNEISDRQKEFYHELDKRSQQLTKQLASDPYTAESVKRLLREEMDTMAMDGKNAYLKATNAAYQIQLLEKKVENINLILKKYELSK